MLFRDYILKKITDVIPLNLLLHFTDHKFHMQYTHLANILYAHKQIKTVTKSHCNYDRKAKNKPMKIYKALLIEKRARLQTPGPQNTVQIPSNKQDEKQESQYDVNNTVAIFEIGNENPIDQSKIIDIPLTMKQNQIDKQVVNTIIDIQMKGTLCHIS